MSEISLHINSLLRHRHTIGKWHQQADLQLNEPDAESVEVVEMSKFKM